MGQQSQQDRRSGQMNMFAALASEHSGTSRAPSIALPDIPEFDAADLLKFEKELLGFYITSHPLAEHQAILDRYTTATTKEALAARENTEVIIGGMMARVRKTVTKNGRSAGQQMAMITLEDLEGQIDGTLFAETLSAVNLKYPNAISKESIVFIKGKVDKKRETPSILINEVIPLADAPARMTTAIVLKLDRTRHDVEVLRRLKPLLARHRGPTPVFVQVSSNGDGSVLLSLPKDQFIRFTPAMVSDLELLLGAASVEPCGPGTRRAKRIAQQQLFAASELDTPAPDSVPVTPDDEQLASLELETELAV